MLLQSTVGFVSERERDGLQASWPIRLLCAGRSV